MALSSTTGTGAEAQAPIGVVNRMREDIQAVFDRDPAARTVLEVVLAYPGLHAIWMYRAAHWLWEHRLCLLGRLLSELARWITGIEIHPGAIIGRRLFIDHGMGVVIGETTEIGDDVLIYQGVTLGGTSLKKEKRHPTIEDHVMISAGAAVIGPVRIGRGSRIGAGAVVVSSAPPYSTIVGIPGKVIEGESTRQDVAGLDHVHLPDPVARAMQSLVDKLNRIGVRIEELEERQDCLEDKLNPNVSPNVPPNVSENVPDAPVAGGEPEPPKER
jgi:serine O-acetyltransferase